MTPVMSPDPGNYPSIVLTLPPDIIIPHLLFMVSHHGLEPSQDLQSDARHSHIRSTQTHAFIILTVQMYHYHKAIV